LGPGRGQTKRYAMLEHHHPEPSAQHHLALGLLPLGCSSSATWRLGCFLLAVVQALGGGLTWAFTSMAQS